MENPIFLTEPEAADYLSRSADTLRDWRAKSKGPPYLKLDTGSVLYEQADLVAWARKNRVDPSGEAA